MFLPLLSLQIYIKILNISREIKKENYRLFFSSGPRFFDVYESVHAQ